MSPDEYQAAIRTITDALRDSIGAHGPINRRYSANTAKRIAHALWPSAHVEPDE